MCWPAQARAEEAVMAAIRREGREVRRGHAYRPRKRPRLHRQPEARHRGVPQHPAGRAAGGGAKRSGSTAIMCCPASYSHRGPDSDRGQLERPVARAGRHAQPQRLADQGRRALQHAVERGFHGRVLPGRSAPVAGAASPCAHDTSATCGRSQRSACRPRRKPPARTWPRNCAATRPSWASSTRAAWACTTPSSPTNSCMPTGRVQGAAEPVGALCRHAQRAATTRRSAVRALAGRARACSFHTGPNPETDLTDGQILEQCKMYIAALRIADDFGCDVDRHSISAGLEGPGAGVRPGGGPAQ